VTGRAGLVLLVALVMVAFAANSLLNRAAVSQGEIGATAFAAIRTVAGAVTLAALVLLRRRGGLPPGRVMAVGALSLATYMIGFSVAYLQLDAGIGALILFGGVQLTMFAGGLAGGERPALRRWIGSWVALAGLAWMFWPTHGVEVDPLAALAMGAAALGWGVYSLNGRRTTDPLAATAANFVLAAPLCALAALLVPAAAPATVQGILLAVVSGAVTSGLGYALWYAVLPRLTATAASLTQPSVPVIVLLGGALLLGEAVAPATALAAALVLGGVAWGSLPARRQRTIGSSGS
jgi:drug/metabolite transporter (DMT)-like permease